MDDLARAYSVLGVPPGATPAQLRRRYRALAKRWHPDRHSADPQGQVEAAATMREVNDAYRTVLRHLVVTPGDPGNPHTKARQPAIRGRLSREEIERIVRALETNGPVDELLDSLDSSAGSDFLYYLGELGVLVAALLILNWLGMPLSSAPMAWIGGIGVVFVHILLFRRWWRRLRAH